MDNTVNNAKTSKAKLPGDAKKTEKRSTTNTKRSAIKSKPSTKKLELAAAKKTAVTKEVSGKIAIKRTRRPNLRYSKEIDVQGAQAQEKTSDSIGLAEIDVQSKKADQKPKTLSTSEEEKTSLGVAVMEQGAQAQEKNSNSIGLVASVQKDQKGRKNKKLFRYEVDCTAIDDMNIADFQDFLRSHAKVAVRLKARGMTVIINFAVYKAKRYVKFLTKKYLRKKKIDLVSVITKTGNSYKLLKK